MGAFFPGISAVQITISIFFKVSLNKSSCFFLKSSDASLAYPEVLRMELERLDNLQSSVWPLTQFRRETIGDEEIVVEPDMKAIQTALGIMDRRAKLLGMDVQNVNLNVQGTTDVRHTLAGEDLNTAGQIDYRAESMQLLDLMRKSGVLQPEVIEKVLAEVEESTSELEIIDAEPIEGDDGDE